MFSQKPSVALPCWRLSFVVIEKKNTLENTEWESKMDNPEKQNKNTTQCVMDNYTQTNINNVHKSWFNNHA